LNIKKLIFPSLAVCAVLALAFRFLTRTTSAQRESDGDSYDEIDAYLERELRRLNVPGAALVVVEGDEIVHLRGFGQARPGGETPTPQTPFLLGSLTKSFTALAVMQLVEAGQIDLDAPAQDYLPWFRVADPAASAQITVRHLLNQTSGLPGLPGMTNLADFDSRPDAVERQVRALSTVELTRPVGSAYEYSNLNYNVLGLIVEAASGEPYADYVQHHIFDPLNMTHSYTSQAAARADGLAVGHLYWFGSPIAAPNLPMPGGSLPSGQLIVSPEDMGRYLIAYLNEGRSGGAQVISPEGIAELHRPVAEAVTMGVSTGHYAMGWFVEQYGESTVIWHTGTVPDFFAFMALLPDQNRGMALLINANHVMMDKLPFTEMGMGAALRLTGQTPPPFRFGVIPWVLRAMLIVPILQIAGVVITLRRLRRWRDDPAGRPSRGRMWGRHIALPLIPNLLLAALPLYLIGSGLLGFMRLFMPDLTWLALIGGGFAAVWSILRTGLILRTLRGPQPSELPIRRDASPA
jgi:CubicO group peptidase (beta-lactamase class C family)